MKKLQRWRLPGVLAAVAEMENRAREIRSNSSQQRQPQ